MTASVVKYSKHIESRGELYTIYDRRTLLRKTPLAKKILDFKQDKISVSYKGVIRGFHGDSDTCKLITCLDGIIQLVVYDVDKKQKQQFILDSNSDELTTVIVPPRHLNAHQCLSKSCIFMYKWSEYYTCPEDQWSVNYNDLDIDPSWIIPETVVSDRDRKAGNLKDLYEKIK